MSSSSAAGVQPPRQAAAAGGGEGGGHEHAGEFSNYDVLLAKNRVGTLVLDPHQNHIGNNRFQILTNMHREEFDERLIAGADPSVVVQKITAIVCQQCVPPGRFLLTEGRGSWIVLTTDEIEAFVLEFLMSPLSGQPRLTPPEALTNSLPIKAATAASSSAVAAAAGVEDSTSSAVEKPPAQPPSQPPQSQLQQPPAQLRATMAADLDTEKKRRRRSSLLRRSISDGSFDDKKKLGRSLVDKLPNLLQVPKPAWFTKKFTGSNATMTNTTTTSKESLQALDVLFNRRKTKLTERHTGNNRLAVMIKMQQNAYQSSDEKQRKSMVQEVYQTVTDAWKGRFFAETPDKRGVCLLAPEDARGAITGLFDPDSVVAIPQPPPPSATTAADHHPNDNDDEALEPRPLDESASSAASIDSKRPSVVKHESIQALHRLKPVEDSSGMRNAALASLQKRKHKQSLNSRIRDLTAGFRTGPSSSAPLAALGRSASAPVENFPSIDESGNDNDPEAYDSFDGFPMNFTPVPLPMIPASSAPLPRGGYNNNLAGYHPAAVPSSSMASFASLPQAGLPGMSNHHLPQQQQQHYQLPQHPQQYVQQQQQLHHHQQQLQQQAPSLVRPSMMADMDAGLIEELLSGLDVSSDFTPHSASGPANHNVYGNTTTHNHNHR